MHGIMYLRKSREDEQYEKNTGEDILQIHRERLAALCKSRGITFNECAEVKSGDTIAGRPKFQQILDIDMPSGQYDCIVVTEISRLGRGDMEDAGRIYKTIINFNIKIATPNRIYDPTNPADLRSLRFELFMSREEYEGIKERLWNNRNYRATQGYAGNYIVTLGYRQSRGNVEVIPEEAALVKEIFQMRAEEYSFQEIADYFNSRTLKTKRGTKYYESTICKILRNPRYIGIARWKGKEYPAKHPPLISQELWDKVQETNSSRSHTRRGAKDENPYLVELYCHECGSRMYGEHTHPRKTIKSGVQVLYNGNDIYVCVGKRKNPKCTHQIKASIIHERILEELKNIATNPFAISKLAKERESRIGINTDGLNVQLAELNKQLKLKGHFRSKIEGDYESGELSALLYTKHIEKTAKELSTIEARIKKTKAEISRSNIKIDAPEELKLILTSFLEKWNNYPNKSKKLIIRSFLPQIRVDKQETFYIARSLPVSLADLA